MKLTFELAKCTENKEGKFVWTLIVNPIVEMFGVKKTVKRTYYIGGMPKGYTEDEIKAGVKFVEDLDKFNVEIRPYVLPESNEEIPCKWLHAKPY